MYMLSMHTSDCSDMYIAAGELLKAADIMIDNGWIDQ